MGSGGAYTFAAISWANYHLGRVNLSIPTPCLLVRDVSELPSGFDLERDLNISLPADSLALYLKPWQVLRLIPKSKSNLRMMVESAFLNLTFANSLLFNVDWGK